MSSAVWNLLGHAAELVTSSATARVDLSFPGRGVHQLTRAGGALPRCELLGVDVHDAAPAQPQSPAEAYVRGSDLIAVYEPHFDRPVRVHVCWRWLGGLESFADSVGFELQVSVQTELLDAQPERFTRTQVPHGSIGRRSRAPRATWQWTGEKPLAQTATATDQPGLLLVRPVGADWSYLELVDPRNAAGHRLAPFTDDEDLLLIAERLFPGHLEKGVILRSRVRGWFLPRSNDEQAAIAADRQLGEAVLPLTA